MYSDDPTYLDTREYSVTVVLTKVYSLTGDKQDFNEDDVNIRLKELVKEDLMEIIKDDFELEETMVSEI